MHVQPAMSGTVLRNQARDAGNFGKAITTDAAGPHLKILSHDVLAGKDNCSQL